MGFRKGNKLGKGGKRTPPGGRPTREAAQLKHDVIQIVQRKLYERADKLIKRFLARALKDDRMTLAAINKLLPDAKQEVQVTGDFKFKIRQEVINKILGREN